MIKGVTIISEVLIAIVVLTMTVILALMASGVIGTQISTIIGTAESGLVQELRYNVERVEHAEGDMQIAYSPSMDHYSLRAEGQQVQITASDQTATYTLVQAEFEPVEIEDAEELCIRRNNTQIEIEEGECETPDMEDICEDGCDPFVCYPEWEDCDASGCNCAEDSLDDEASDICDSNYDPEYIDQEADPTTDFGCVNENYVEVQEEGERCEREFECVDNLQCSEGAGVEESICCPEGEVYNPDEDSCEVRTNYDIVYAPVNYDNSEHTKYEKRSKNYHDHYVQRSPFQSSTEDIELHTAKNIEGECEINLDTGTDWEPSANPRSSWPAPWSQLRDCATEIYGDNDWNKVKGVCNEQEYCSRITLGGMAIWFGSGASFTDARSTDLLDLDPARISTHEIGHAQELSHINNEQLYEYDEQGDPTGVGVCDLGPADSPGSEFNYKGCGEHGPNAPEDCKDGLQAQNYIMTYCEGSNEFGPAAYNHLENVYLDPYLGEKQ